MKALQVVVLLAVLVGGVFGLTLLTQYTKAPVQRAADKAGPGRSVPPLRVPENQAVWDTNDTNYVAEFEKGPQGQGHYDFWVSNANPKPVSVSLLSKSCTCAEVKLGIVPAAALAAARAANPSRQEVLGDKLGVSSPPGVDVLKEFPELAKAVEWHPLVRERDLPPVPVTVPAADPTAGTQLAVIRLGWEARDVKSMRLAAEVQHQFDNNLETTRFEVPLQIVPPLLVSAPSLNIGDLSYGEQRDARLFIWSATRPAIDDLRVEEVLHDPCTEVGAPVPLNSKELEQLPTYLLQSGMTPQRTKPRCAYVVKVTVSEHRGNNQLELGPLSRKLLVKGADEQEVPVMLTGHVRGAIRVGEANDRDRIDLGSFRAERPWEKEIIVTSSDPNLRLEVVQKVPESLKVELKDQRGGLGQKRWRLWIGVEPNTFSGLLPSDTAVYLQTLTNPPRRMRVPVTGNATH